MKRRALVALCLAIGGAGTGSDATAEPTEPDVLRVRIYEGWRMSEYGLRLADLGVHEVARRECRSTRESPCPAVPVSPAWQEKSRQDAERLKERGFNLPTYLLPSISPDGARIVRAVGDHYDLIEVADRRATPFPRVAGRTLTAYAWVGAKGCFLLLTRTSSLDLMPWNWLAAFSGHPVQRDTHWLELRSPNGAPLLEAAVERDVRDSSAFLVVVPGTAGELDAQVAGLPGDC